MYHYPIEFIPEGKNAAAYYSADLPRNPLRSRMKDEDSDSFLFLLDDGAFGVGNLGCVNIAMIV